MPSPDTSLATLRPDLGGSVEEFGLLADRQGFIGHRVATVIEADQQSGPYGQIPLEQLLRKRSTNRTNRGGYPRGDWTFTKNTYATEEHGFEEPIDDRDARMYGNYFMAEVIAAELALDVVLRNAEQRIADMIFNATTWTGAALNTTVTNEWDNAANATPIADVKAAVQAVYDACGLWPNALVINKKVFQNLQDVAEIIDRLKYNGLQDVRKENITAAALAMLFGLEEVIVAGGTKNTADEGQAASPSTIWSSEYAMVCRVARTNNIKEPCIARTIHWGGDGSSIGGTFETYRDETVRGDVARARHDVDELVILTEAGHLLDNITS